MILWSGGVESTSLLKQLLIETQDEIHAHYIKFHNPEWNRTQYEQRAVRNLTPLLSRIRPFEYSESEVSICDGQAWPHDGQLQYFIGIMAAHHKRCERLHRVHCLEDAHLGQPNKNGVFTYHTPNNLTDRFHSQIKWVEPFLLSYQKLNEMCPYLPCYNWPKTQHIAYLGDMFPYTWTCRTPKNEKECGHCLSCLERDAAMKGHSNCPNVEKMLNSN